MAKYVYPAVFTPEESGSYSVYFPDFEGCYTCGDDLKDALFMAEDVLAFTLYEYEKEKKPVPEIMDIKTIELSEDEFINYIACDTIEYVRLHNNKAIKKTLSIPEWLNELAMRENINFSQLLQDALMQRLNVQS